MLRRGTATPSRRPAKRVRACGARNSGAKSNCDRQRGRYIEIKVSARRLPITTLN